MILPYPVAKASTAGQNPVPLYRFGVLRHPYMNLIYSNPAKIPADFCLNSAILSPTVTL